MLLIIINTCISVVLPINPELTPGGFVFNQASCSSHEFLNSNPLPKVPFAIPPTIAKIKPAKTTNGIIYDTPLNKCFKIAGLPFEAFKMKSPLFPLGSPYIFAFVKLSLIVCLASLTTGFVPQVYVFTNKTF
ncbi:MAG: hypothetical protein H9Q65_02140 [Spiroplasma ixodetis]|nr:hypothetical protein [Spiroplasma ixodetis]MBP1528046.1 hypothetical protein [Spiroplasma ixodetis]